MPNYRKSRILLGLALAGLVTCIKPNTHVGVGPHPRPSAVNKLGSLPPCNQLDLDAALINLSTGNWEKSRGVREQLQKNADSDSKCRSQIIASLMRAMNKPDLDFLSNQRDYFLWLEGSRLLGDLKATEALDLLISRSDLNDGLFSASMNHQPAIIGIVRIGSPAIPKLSEALSHNDNRGIRQAAAFCLGAIGGTSAVASLKRSRQLETDECVGKMIRLSLEVAAKEAKSRSRSATQTDFNAEVSARSARLLAFSCK